MKPLKHSLLLFALMIVIICCNQTSTQEGLIIVQDYPANQGEPEIDLESHKTGDVEIYRVNYFEEGYEIIYYHDISGKIRDYHFYRVDTINYSQGFYNWKNDTTVTVKLYNSETKQEFNVELFPTRDRNVSGGVRLIDKLK
jgi:hypothetical protein